MIIRRIRTGLPLRSPLPAFACMRGTAGSGCRGVRSRAGISAWDVAGNGEQDNGGRVSATGSAM